MRHDRYKSYPGTPKHINPTEKREERANQTAGGLINKFDPARLGDPLLFEQRLFQLFNGDHRV